MPLNPPRQRNLFALLRARRCGKLDGDIAALERHDTPAGLGSADIDKQRLAHEQFRDFGFFRVVCFDTEQTAQEEDCW